ncbi:uncharacterized protein BYT42DRAFT_193540 [Radiomyces spectabilis]|uniref:uncharacterized protein n=1 Tax=Radiomyces spectabilis TaxID=64574 RepID=UPI002220D7B6|nr:uncharacterized protein BYT42DRAFT_193540 [Radiomyces spectabilis]KAI8391410.1 hypothetical protein BYT42DRAFT_193540 [Radiomyces spectabilis]
MVQNMASPIAHDNHKSVYINGHHPPYDGVHTPRASPPHPPMPIPMPMPMMGQVPHHQQAFFTGHPPPPPHFQTVYNTEQGPQAYCDYTYHIGFMQGYFSDINVVIPGLSKPYALHSLNLSRSPVLRRRLAQLDPHQPRLLELDLPVSAETLHTVIGYLYKPLTQHEVFYLVSEKPRLCVELLEATEELELDGLLDMLLHALGQSLNQSSIHYWITQMHPFRDKQRRWVEAMEQRIIHFLTVGLSVQLDATPSTIRMTGNINIGHHSADGYMPSKRPLARALMDLADIYAALPVTYLKRCLEHEELPVQDTIHRYCFAKEVLAQRAQKYGKSGVSVILRFEHGQSKILVVRKAVLAPGRWDPSKYDNDEDD